MLITLQDDVSTNKMRYITECLISEIMKNTWSFVTNTVKQETTNMFSRDYSQSFPSGNILMK